MNLKPKILNETIKNYVDNPSQDSDIQKQIKSEHNYVSSFENCPSNIKKSSIITRLHNIDISQFKDTVKTNFYNSQLMEVVACITESLTLYTGNYSLTVSERMRHFLNKLRKIGANSEYGYAMTDDFFVLKAPKKQIDSDELYHECMIGFGALNNLRKYVPNFAYIYGIVNCAPPFIEENEIIAWCNTTKMSVSYAIYENINPFKDFSKYCETCTPNQFFQYYLQICLALREAQLTSGFSHNDLHAGNVGLKKLSDENISIPYNTENGLEYLTCDGSIAFIIDYGMSHIQLEENGEIVHYGCIQKGITKYGIYRDRCNTIIDVYKLLAFSLYVMKTNKNPAYSELKGLFSFFTNVDIGEFLESQKNNYFCIPEQPNFRIDQFIRFVREYIVANHFIDPISPLKPEDIQIVECDGTCKSFNESMKSAGLDLDSKTPIPTTFIEFYDSYGTLIYKNHKKTAARVAKKFKENFESIFKNEKIEINTLIDNLNPCVIYEFPLNATELYHDTVLIGIKNACRNYINFFDTYNNAVLKLVICKFIKKLFQIESKKYLKLYKKLKNKIAEIKEFSNKLLEKIRVQILFLKNNPFDDKKNIKYKWYWDTFPTVDSYIY